MFAEGSVGAFKAIRRAQELLTGGQGQDCVVAAADSLIDAQALLDLSRRRGLLTEDNSDGVIPGEAAGCLLLSAHPGRTLASMRGAGFAHEPATLDNDVPLRGEGITTAARRALAEAGLALHDIDFRVSDAAGESFSFKEQALLLARLLRQRRADFPLTLCAEVLGQTGAAAGLCGLISAIAAFGRQYAPGPRAIAFASAPGGERAALIVERHR